MQLKERDLDKENMHRRAPPKARRRNSWFPAVGLIGDWHSRETLGEETSHSAAGKNHSEPDSTPGRLRFSGHWAPELTGPGGAHSNYRARARREGAALFAVPATGTGLRPTG